jgi:hypothetical protein
VFQLPFFAPQSTGIGCQQTFRIIEGMNPSLETEITEMSFSSPQILAIPKGVLL